jgi:non-lysosomal glucosylceramidase
MLLGSRRQSAGAAQRRRLQRWRLRQRFQQRVAAVSAHGLQIVVLLAVMWSLVLAAAGLAVGGEQPGGVLAKDHFVPVEKNLDPSWVKSLSERGQRTWYSGNELDTIAMPIGGICTGQVYLAGDGRLMHWDIFNRLNFTGYGATNYKAGRKPTTPLDQGFGIRVRSEGKTAVRTLDRKGFPRVRFCGEYPIGFVQYRDEDFPVTVSLEAFSPFVPLDAFASAMPAVLMHFTVENSGSQPVEVTLFGWLQNAVCLYSGAVHDGQRVNRIEHNDQLCALECWAEPAKPTASQRPPRVLADFETGDYGQWKTEGEAFGKGPAKGTFPKQQRVSGYLGKGLVNTYLDGSDAPQGKLVSPQFVIDRRYITFLIGGGNHPGKTCINLLVDGKVVRTATGKNNEKLEPHYWDVAELEGRQARIEIVDAESGPWGHINIDQIELRDRPTAEFAGPLEKQPDFGSMTLALLRPLPGAQGVTSVDDPSGAGMPAAMFDAESGKLKGGMVQTAQPFDKKLWGAVAQPLVLRPGQKKTVVFAVTWSFPNRDKGNYYDRWNQGGPAALATHLAKELERLGQTTRLWHQTWYDSTLPYWLLDRLFSTTSILATSTCQWWGNGRFWAWEGVGCCHGTCAHVWNYQHAMARLFPELERSVREMQDYGAGFIEETGEVRFRGEGWGLWAGDSQPGTVLKAYREHQISADDRFLRRLWPKVRKSLEFLIAEDGKDGQQDGLIQGKQHNTYDIDFYGPNTMVGSLYLAALRAGEEMAREMGQHDFAALCRQIFERGSRVQVERLFNGEYFIQEVDLAKHPKFQYADGCLADQLFGQGWAHQVGLGYIYPREIVVKTLQSIWKYNWAPDIGPQNKAHPPERWFADPGEAGLFICTWPKSKHLGENGVRYRDEVWTGIEYQVAGNMVWEGMLTEALAICRAVHQRYHPSKRNPWNEVECGDHYSRAMASYGVFLALCGFEYHGPKGHFGFAPRLGPEDFRAAFTAAEGWGTIAQQRQAEQQRQQIAVRWGKLRLATLAFELPEGAKLAGARVALGQHELNAHPEQQGRRVTIRLAEPVVVAVDQTLEAVLRFTR